MKQSAKFSIPWIKISILAVILVLAGAACVHYNPALYPSYDVLNPGPEVRLNPISVTSDEKGNPIFTVNAAFLQWVDELKTEIIKLRKGT